jgi:hypothetical protein
MLERHLGDVSNESTRGRLKSALLRSFVLATPMLFARDRRDRTPTGSVASQAVSEAIGELAAKSETSASTEQIAASAQELAQSAASLDELVKHFHLQ